MVMFAAAPGKLWVAKRSFQLPLLAPGNWTRHSWHGLRMYLIGFFWINHQWKTWTKTCKNHWPIATEENITKDCVCPRAWLHPGTTTRQASRPERAALASARRIKTGRAAWDWSHILDMFAGRMQIWMHHATWSHLLHSSAICGHFGTRDPVVHLRTLLAQTLRRHTEMLDWWLVCLSVLSPHNHRTKPSFFKFSWWSCVGFLQQYDYMILIPSPSYYILMDKHCKIQLHKFNFWIPSAYYKMLARVYNIYKAFTTKCWGESIQEKNTNKNK